MFDVSARFTAAESADGNKPVGQVLLALGDYANADAYGAVASSSAPDASGSFPASGPINGDRTEINIGAASVADNGIGLASWKSAGIPDAGDFVWWQVDLGQIRTLNRLKLYHRAGHGLRSYVISYSVDGVVWNTMVVTSDVGVGGGDAWGEGAWGDGVWGGGATPAPVVFPTTMDLDVIDTAADISARFIKIVASRTEVASEAAQIVALEVYRLVDISSRAVDVRTNRSRDFKLSNPIAATAGVQLSNEDRYFSRRYVPTAAEVAAGYINSELRTGMGLIVKLGFAFSGGVGELVQKFTGTVDELGAVASNDPSADAMAALTARDGMKDVIDAVVSAGLRTNIDVSEAARYLLNLANISNYEMELDTSGVTLDYFFTFETNVLTSLQQLVGALPDAEYYIDEEGKHHFAVYAIPRSFTDTTEADFTAAVLKTNVNLTTTPGAVKRRWQIVDDFDGDTLPKSFWTKVEVNGAWTCSTNVLRKANAASATNDLLSTYIIPDEAGFTALGYGTWEMKQWLDNNVDDNAVRTWIIRGNLIGIGYSPGIVGYYLEVTPTVTRLVKRTATNPPGFSETVIITVARVGASTDVYRVTRTSAGLFTLYINTVSQGTATDTFQTNSTAYALEAVPAAGASAAQNWDGLYYSQEVLDPSVAVVLSVPRLVSRTVDQGADIQTEGIFQATTTVQSGSQIDFETETSADDISFDPFVDTSQNAAIASTARRYLRWAVELVGVGYRDCNVGGILYDVTINWAAGGGSPKIHPVVDFTMRGDADMLNISEKLSQSIGGDTSVINDVTVTSAPLLLAGADADTVWQGVAGSPAAPVSAGNPLTLSAGNTDFPIIVNNGMDISRMSGASPAAGALSGGTATYTWTFVRIHPTKPTLRINCTVPGTITDLRVIGKTYTNSQTPLQAVASDAASIGLNRKKSKPLQNNYIISQNVAQLVANRQILNFKDETGYVDGAAFSPTYSMQVRDRVKAIEERSLALNHDYAVVGLEDYLSVNGEDVSAGTYAVMVAIT